MTFDHEDLANDEPRSILPQRDNWMSFEAIKTNEVKFRDLLKRNIFFGLQCCVSTFKRSIAMSFV